MRLKTRPLVAVIGLLAVVATLAASGGAPAAQEPTPAGRLGGGAPLDATIPVATAPPTASPTRDPAASPTAVASPVGSPVAGESLAPVDCIVAPRSLDDVAALLMLAEPPAAPFPPTADGWTPEARIAAEAVVAELVACGNAGRQLAAYALLTDNALVEYLIGVQPARTLSVLRALFFDEEPSLIPIVITGLETRPGEPGTVYLWLDPGTGEGVAVRLTVAQERGSWRIAGITIFPPNVT